MIIILLSFVLGSFSTVSIISQSFLSTLWYELEAQPLDMGILPLFSYDKNNTFGFPLSFYNGTRGVDFYGTRSLDFPLKIDNGTNVLTVGNKTEFLRIDGRVQNQVGELLFSNGTNTLIVGNKTEFLQIDNGINNVTVGNKTELLEINNGTLSLGIDQDSWSYQYQYPGQFFAYANPYEELFRVFMPIFG